MNNASGQLYVAATSEQDQFTIDNYSGKTFQDGETVPLNDYFRIGGYFGSYGPHLFAAAPQMRELLEIICDADECRKLGGLSNLLPDFIRVDVDEILKQSQGEQA